MMSTLSFTSSAASSGSRSTFSSADRYSMTMVFPSTYPRSCKPCRNASTRAEIVEKEFKARSPTVGTFFGCCAATGRESAHSKAPSAQLKNCFLKNFVQRICRSLLLAPCSMLFYNAICPRQQIRRNSEPDLLGRFKIDDKFELLRLLHREIGRLCPLKNFVNVVRGATKQVSGVWRIGHQAAGFHLRIKARAVKHQAANID